jgi:hypothetical protein
MNKSGVFITALLWCLSSVHGQIDDAYAGIHTSLLLPAGDFVDEDDFYDDGYALPGIGVGVDFTLPIGHPSIALYSSLSMLINFLNKDEAEENVNLGGLVSDLEGGTYFQFPFLTGVKFSLPVPEDIPIYFTGQAGFNVLKQTSIEGTIFAGTPFRSEIEIESDPAFTFAAAFGAGVVFFDHLNLGSRFLFLGKPEIEFEVNGNQAQQDREFDVWNVQFFAGWNF